MRCGGREEGREGRPKSSTLPSTELNSNVRRVLINSADALAAAATVAASSSAAVAAAAAAAEANIGINGEASIIIRALKKPQSCTTLRPPPPLQTSNRVGY